MISAERKMLVSKQEHRKRRRTNWNKRKSEQQEAEDMEKGAEKKFKPSLEAPSEVAGSPIVSQRSKQKEAEGKEGAAEMKFKTSLGAPLGIPGSTFGLQPAEIRKQWKLNVGEVQIEFEGNAEEMFQVLGQIRS